MFYCCLLFCLNFSFLYEETDNDSKCKTIFARETQLGDPTDPTPLLNLFVLYVCFCCLCVLEKQAGTCISREIVLVFNSNSYFIQ